MKFKSLFKKSNLITCEKGWCQGSFQGLVFIEHFPELEHLTFACDAKLFVEALDILDSPKFMLNGDTIVLADTTQDITLKCLNGEILFEIPVAFEVGNFAKFLNYFYNFVKTDYPVIRLQGGYVEALSNTFIYREEHNFKTEDRVLIAYKLPATAEGYKFMPEGLWHKYSSEAFILQSYYTELLPRTQRFFTEGHEWKTLPQFDLLNVDLTEFRDGMLIQQSDTLQDHIIEGFELEGTYNTEDLKLMQKIATHWDWSEGLIHFKSLNGRGVIGEAV